MTMIKESWAPVVGPIVAGSFAEGPSYHTFRSRGTTDWLIIATRGGCGRFRIHGNEWPARERVVYLIAPGAMHDYGTASKPGHWSFDWAHFVPLTHWNSWLDWPELDKGLLRCEFDNDDEYKLVTHALASAHKHALSSRPNGKALAMNALESALILCSGNIAVDRKPDDERIRRTIEAICQQVEKPWDMRALADLSCLSVSRFAHLFKMHTGATPQRYIEDKRMERARHLLSLSDLKVQEIARQVGYENVFYFSNRFKARVGMAPSDYRAALNRTGQVR